MSSKFFTMICLSILMFTTVSFFIRTSDAANVVAIWLLDEGKGQEIEDASGNGHTGEFFGKPEWTDGKIGKGIRFHGAPDHIEVPDFTMSTRQDTTCLLGKSR